MNRRYRIILASLFLVLLAASSSLAQYPDDWGMIEIESACTGTNEVTLTVTVNPWIYGQPEGWAGWVIMRRTVGKCSEDVQISDVLPLYTEPTEFTIVDTIDEPGFDVLYRGYGIDAAGELQHQTVFPYRKWFEHAHCLPGSALRGEVQVQPGGYVFVEACPENCWIPMSYLDMAFPLEMIPYEGQIVEVFGELRAGMEGVYMDIDFWFVNQSGCGPVADEDMSWGTLKARYR